MARHSELNVLNLAVLVTTCLTTIAQTTTMSSTTSHSTLSGSTTTTTTTYSSTAIDSTTSSTSGSTTTTAPSATSIGSTSSTPSGSTTTNTPSTTSIGSTSSTISGSTTTNTPSTTSVSSTSSTTGGSTTTNTPSTTSISSTSFTTSGSTTTITRSTTLISSTSSTTSGSTTTTTPSTTLIGSTTSATSGSTNTTPSTTSIDSTTSSTSGSSTTTPSTTSISSTSPTTSGGTTTTTQSSTSTGPATSSTTTITPSITSNGSTSSTTNPPTGTTTIGSTSSIITTNGEDTTTSPSTTTTTSSFTTTMSSSTISNVSMTTEKTTNPPTGTTPSFPVEEPHTDKVIVRINFTMTMQNISLADKNNSELIINMTNLLKDLVFKSIGVTIAISLRKGSIICDINTTTSVANLTKADIKVTQFVDVAAKNLVANNETFMESFPELDLAEAIGSLKSSNKSLTIDGINACSKSYEYIVDSHLCLHKCDNKTAGDYCGENGECYFDIKKSTIACRCKESPINVYHGPQCEHMTAELSFVLAMSLGIGGGILVIAAIIIGIMCVRRPRKGKQIWSCCKRGGGKEDDNKSAFGDLPQKSSPFGERVYESLSLSNFSIRRPAISGSPNPLYRRNSGSLQGDAMDMFDYSLHQEPKRNSWQKLADGYTWM